MPVRASRPRRRHVLAIALAVSIGALAPTPAVAVVGGVQALPGEAPWAVGLVASPRRIAASQFCGATLVAPDTVVTATHCLFEAALAEGSDDREKTRPRVFPGHVLPLRTGPIRAVAWAAVHPDIEVESSGLSADIAVLRLRRPLPGAVPLAYAVKADGGAYPAGSAVSIFGWGNRSGRHGRINLPRELQRGDLERYSDARCNELYGRMFNPAVHLCAGRPDGSVDACDGDSGGPLVATPADRPPLLVGIVSFGQGCGEPDFPTIYTKVARYATWLKKMIATRGTPRGENVIRFDRR